MNIRIRPACEPQRELDVTDRLVAAIAEELWRHYGGNAHLNWLEAERHLQRIVDGARAQAATPPARPRPARAAGADVAACPGCPKRRTKPVPDAPVAPSRVRPVGDRRVTAKAGV